MAQCFRDLGEAGHAGSRRPVRVPLAGHERPLRARPGLQPLPARHRLRHQDESEQASAVGRQALDLTVRLTSARSVRYVRDLVRTFRPEPTSQWSRTSRPKCNSSTTAMKYSSSRVSSSTMPSGSRSRYGTGAYLELSVVWAAASGSSPMALRSSGLRLPSMKRCAESGGKAIQMSSPASGTRGPRSKTAAVSPSATV
jgi:hypothetical protein